MEYVRISQIELDKYIGQRVFVKFMVSEATARLQKDGVSKFIALTMTDGAIHIEAKKFGATDNDIAGLSVGKVVRAALDINEYSKSPDGYSCIIYNFEVLDEEPSNYVEWAAGVQEAVGRLGIALSRLDNTFYGGVVRSLLTEQWSKFSISAAGSSHHHNLLGGLMVHTMEVYEQSELLGTFWTKIYDNNFINMDLLLSAALLHDIGKVKELSTDPNNGSVQYTTQSALGTHITIGVLMIHSKFTELGIGIPQDDKPESQLNKEMELIQLLEHCILSHHGKLEYGSPIEASIPEAYILSQADIISADMYKYNKTIKGIEPGTSKIEWRDGKKVVTYNSNVI